MLILSADQVRQALPMIQAIEAMKDAYEALSAGRAIVPLRTPLEIKESAGLNLFMPAYLSRLGVEGSLVVKVVGVYTENPGRGLPVIHASVLVSEAATGKPLALLEGASLTAIRTGAGSGAATDILARPDCRVAAIIGAGVQAKTQLEAVCSVRPIERVWIYDHNPGKAERFIEEMAGRKPISKYLLPAPDPRTAVREADIICTATTSTSPVFDDADLKPGVHINGVGSFTAQMQEIPYETVVRAKVYVDSRPAALAEAGDLIQPIEAGGIAQDHIVGEIGEVILKRIDGRQSTEEITFFKSVGVAVQDAAAAGLALENARRLGLGQQVDW